MALITMPIGGPLLADQPMAHRYRIVVQFWPVKPCAKATTFFAGKFVRDVLMNPSVLA